MVLITKGLFLVESLMDLENAASTRNSGEIYVRSKSLSRSSEQELKVRTPGQMAEIFFVIRKKNLLAPVAIERFLNI